ncbi:hypothetical protein RGQ13_09260 [Thalassotalea psychrophila]|uniref:Porin n=1 Tax=Thalassotalea psychrophila TaxID=3065647 RepID=A0ABY9TZ41_9GAMM|nr:hypothetical protein RGQ13_09260 [Colwelliaceae bacterium SQ149]
MKTIAKLSIGLMAILTAHSTTVLAEEEVQDMSDPLAVYSQFGAGVTNKGLNLKYGQSYDTGNPNTFGMNVLELKGLGGEDLGWDNNAVKDNSVDSFRFRNFQVDMTNGRGSQLDISLGLDANALADESGSVSYSFIQALPKFGKLSLFPLAGVGAGIANNALEDDGTVDSGYSVQGTYYLVGMYSKYAITDKLWVNYNPFYLETLSGSDVYQNNAYGQDESSILTHEASVGYQFTPRFNLRYFANWNENVSFDNGDHRIEFNYQF